MLSQLIQHQPEEGLILLVSADFRTRYSLMYEPPCIQTGVIIVIDVPERMSTVHHQDKGRPTAVACCTGMNPPGDNASLIFKPLPPFYLYLNVI